jgi:hypothetical protein
MLAALAISNAHGDPEEAEAARAKACSLVAHNPAVAPPDWMCPTSASPP